MHNVAFRGFVRTGLVLIRHDCDIHAKSSDDVTILEMAALGEQRKMLEFLLSCDFSFEERYVVLRKFMMVIVFHVLQVHGSSDKHPSFKSRLRRRYIKKHRYNGALLCESLRLVTSIA